MQIEEFMGKEGKRLEIMKKIGLEKKEKDIIEIEIVRQIDSDDNSNCKVRKENKNLFAICWMTVI